MKLDCLTLDPIGPHHATMVLLHGIGQNATDMANVANAMRLSELGIRCVMPNAPRQATSMSGGTTRAWFDQSVMHLNQISTQEVMDAEQDLRELVDTEAIDIGSERVFVSGFSQGASMALIMGLRYPKVLGGLILYAAFLVGGLELERTRSSSSVNTPIWIGHGQKDVVVSVFHGGWIAGALRKLGYDVTWKSYAAGHEPFDGALGDVRDVMVSALKPGPHPAT